MKILLSAVLLIAAAGLAKADTLETITFNLSDLHPGSTLSATFDVPTSLGTGVTTLDVTYSFSDPSDYAEGSLSGPTGGTLAGMVLIAPNTPISNFTVNFSVPVFFNPTGNSMDKENLLSERGLAQCASFPCTATGGFEDGLAFNSLYTVAPSATTSTTPEPSSFLLLATGLAGVGLLYASRKNVSPRPFPLATL